MSEYNYKWIVHPHSFLKRGNREISVIHETEFHAMQSYGWFGDRKILMAKDSMYGDIHDDVAEAAISIAERIANDLNQSGKGPGDNEIKKILAAKKEQDNSFKNMNKQFLKQFDDHIKEIGNRLSNELGFDHQGST